MSSDEVKFDAALDLLRRLDSKNLKKNLQNIINLEPTLAEDLLSTIDTSLVVKKDPKSQQREYLCCDYNRDIDSYRSPWSNTYFPELSSSELDESPFPSKNLRNFEILANYSFDIYKDLYYEGGISSCYTWELNEDNDEEFAGVVLFKKTNNNDLSTWDSIHVFEVEKNNDSGEFIYRVTSTIILQLSDPQNNKINLAGNLNKQFEKIGSQLVKGTNEQKNNLHMINLGSFIEDIELQLRTMLEVVYFEKTRDIFHELKTSIPSTEELNKSSQKDIIKSLENL